MPCRVRWQAPADPPVVASLVARLGGGERGGAGPAAFVDCWLRGWGDTRTTAGRGRELGHPPAEERHRQKPVCPAKQPRTRFARTPIGESLPRLRRSRGSRLAHCPPPPWPARERRRAPADEGDSA